MALQELEQTYYEVLEELRAQNAYIQQLESTMDKIADRQNRTDDIPVDVERTLVAKMIYSVRRARK